jgi:thiosulfate/3-mercaptopyruvate sulfurtransferase
MRRAQAFTMCVPTEQGESMASTITQSDKGISAKGYVRPEVLVSTDWLAQHLDDPKIRIIESDEDVLL